MVAAVLMADAPLEVIGDGGNNTLNGGEGDDFLDGLLGNDIVHGHGGDDVLVDGWTGTDEGVDSLYGDGGNDTIVVYYSNGANYYDGGEGQDTLDLSYDFRGYSTIILGATFTEYGSTFTSFEHVWGTTGHDRIEGSESGNFIFGNAGSDMLNGNGGDDEIVGGAESDIVRGGSGNDILYDNSAVGGGSWYRGDEGNDTIVVFGAVQYDLFDGGTGIDRLDLSMDTRGFSGSNAINLSTTSFTAYGATFHNFEQVIGSQGDDHITGSGLDNLLVGQGGNDIIDGGDGVDTIYGGDGDDEFFDLDTRSDTIYGEAGDDIFHVSNGSGSYFDGGEGNNTLDASRWISLFSPGTFHLDGTQEGYDFFTLGNSRFRNFSNALGTVYDDYIQGHGVLNVIDGGAGIDVISGIGSGSQIITDQDTDYDYIDGGEGADRVVIVGGPNGNYDGGYDVDMLDLSQASVGFSGASTILLDFRTFVSGAGTFKGFESVVGTAFSDQVRGSSGTNDIDGGGGADHVDGGYGDDIIRDGDDSADDLDGHYGNDTFLVRRATDGDSYDGGMGDGDVLDLSASLTGFDATRQLYLTGQGSVVVTGFEQVIGTAFADWIIGASEAETIRGGGGDDRLFGNDGDDVLEGGLGADILDGGSGSNAASYQHADGGVTANLANATQNLGQAQGDTFVSIANLVGSAFADTLVGNASSNTLTGGLGADRLRGGQGADLFVYGSVVESALGADRDVIEDWSTSDRIDIGAIDTDAALFGVQGFVWGGLTSAGAALTPGQLRYYQQGGNTFLVGSSDGDNVADFQLELSGLHTLSAGNVAGLRLLGTSGADLFVGSAGSETFTFAVNNLTALDRVDGGKGEDILTLTGTGTLTAARMWGVSNIETIALSNGGISLVFAEDYDFPHPPSLTIRTSDGNDVVDASAVLDTSREMVFTAGAGNDVFRGGRAGDTFLFAAEDLTDADVISGGDGGVPDELVLASHGQIDLRGVAGIELIKLADAPATPLTAGDGNVVTITDRLLSSTAFGHLIIVGGIGDNTIDASGVTDADYGIDVRGGRGHDRFIGGAGSDAFSFSLKEFNRSYSYSSNDYDSVDGGAGAFDTLVFTDAGYIGNLVGVTGIERVRLADGDNTLTLGFGLTSEGRILEVYGGNGVDLISAGEFGYGPSVELRGFGGNDTLTGGNWDDWLYGGSGNDTLIGNTGKDLLEGGSGLDMYVFAAFWGQDTVNNYAEDHDLVGPDVLAFAYNVNAADIVVGRQGDDLILTRRGSADQITVADFGNGAAYQGLVLQFYDGAKVDQDELYWQFQRLGSEASQEMNGREGNDELVALGGDDTLYGHGGDDLLEGGTGRDLLDGGNGADTAAYRFAAAVGTAGLTVDLANAANNTGEATGDTYVSIENVIGSAFDDRLVGNANANSLYGESGNDHLDGGLGVDQMYGGLGDDTFVISQIGDKAFEAQDQGTDTVLSAVTYSLAGQFIENLTLTGAGNIKATGNSFNNLLTGNSGNNTLAGGIGFDTANWAAATSALIITLDANGDGSVTGTGIGTDQFTGIENVIAGSGADTISGNEQNNRIDGGLGVDQMSGGLGNDVYVVSQAGDKAMERINEGTDTVLAGLSYNLVGQFIENVTLTGTGDFTATGNSLSNRFIGNVGNNLFVGKEGVDTVDFSAAASALTITLDASGNGTTSGTGIGTDSFSGIEYLIGGMADDAITGNAQSNKIQGGAGNDRLDGGAGADRLYGGLGDDTFIVGDVGDKVYEANGEGTDTVLSSISFNLTGQYADNLTLTGTGNIAATGNGLANILTGNAGNNVLAGGGGSDTANFAAATSALNITLDASGGATVTGAGIGTDTLSSIENIIGGSGGDTITGNALANRIDGGLGNDVMAGGRGNDVYVVDGSGDQVIEASNGGNDTVISAVTFSAAGKHIENITLTGHQAVNAIGNQFDNILTGNAASNVLTGGGGNDTFIFNATLDGTSNVDTITDWGYPDRIVLDRSIFTAFEDVGAVASSQFKDMHLGNVEPVDADDRIIFGTDQYLYYDADGSGDGAAIRFAYLPEITGWMGYTSIFIA